MLLKLLGIIDIISALIILFNLYHISWIISAVHVIVLLAKGAPSLFGDAPAILMGSVDVITAILIIFGVTGLLPLKIILFIVLVGKGALSLI